MIDRPQLHASALGTICMEGFRRRYIEGEKMPPGIAIIVGTGTHRSVEANLTHKIETGELLPVEAVKDEAHDGVVAAFESQEIKLTPEEKSLGIETVRGQAIDKAVRLARLHHITLAPGINPRAIERPWSLEIPGMPFDLVGRIDIQELYTIRDTKTSGKTPPADSASKSLQLKAYALAMKIIDNLSDIPAVALDYLVDTATPKAITLTHEPDNDDFQVVLARAEIIARAMNAGVFVPVEPGHWHCNEKWCGYFQTCRYSTKPKQFSIT